MRTIFFVIFLAAGNLNAEVLTWQRALVEARQNNPLLFSAEEELKSASALVKANRGGYFPQMDGILRYQEQKAQEQSYRASLRLRQNIFSGFRDKSLVGEAKAFYYSKNAELTLAKSRLSSDLKRAYSDLLFAQENLLLSQEILKRRRENLDLVNLRYQAGNENKGSVLLAKASLAQSRYDAIGAKQYIEVARQNLGRVLGRDQIDKLAVAGNVPSIKIDDTIKYTDLASKTPEIEIAGSTVQISRYQLQQTRSDFFPSLDLAGEISRSDTSFFPERENWQVGLTLSMPFLDGGRNYYTNMSRQSNFISSRLQLENTTRTVLSNLKGRYYDLILAIEKVQVDLSFLDAAKVRAEISRGRYDNGLMTFEDWIIIENDLIERQKIYIRSQRDKIFAEAAWELAQGKGVYLD